MVRQTLAAIGMLGFLGFVVWWLGRGLEDEFCDECGVPTWEKYCQMSHETPRHH